MSGTATRVPPAATPAPDAAPARPRRFRHPRVVLVTALLAVVTLALAIVALGLGELRLTPAQVVQALLVDDGSFRRQVVFEWRFSRTVVALLFGAALGVAGAMFQSLTRNPLGSPDIIGFASGSYTGALLALTVVNGSAVAGGSTIAAGTGALLGGLVTAAVVYALAYRKGVQGFRLIIVGIGVTALLQSFNIWLLLRASTEVAISASIWGTGSISLVNWGEAVPAGGALIVLFVLAALVSGPLQQLELGDDAARAHGVNLERSRLAIILVGVALTAVVTAVSGPIAFVALAAPQVAARLTKSAGLPLLPSALAGALLLLSADLLAQHVLPGGLPVGVVTICVGGVYLLWLLIHEARRRP